MKVGFHLDSFSLRGVTGSTISLARAWRGVLGNESLLIKSEGYDTWFRQKSVRQYQNEFQIYSYKDTKQLSEVIKKTGIDALYIQTSGQQDERFRNISVPIWIHSVFPSKISDIHGEKYACISEWLAKESFNGKIPYIPHIVNKSLPTIGKEEWAKTMGIQRDSVIIGSLGGQYSFDLKIAQEGIIEALNKRENIYFISLNHKRFTTHERAIFLAGTDDPEIKSNFISSCDAMLHGRAQGETFGLACAEFAAAGKPIFAWRHSPEQHHLKKFCQDELKYSKIKELTRKIVEFDKDKWNPNLISEKCDEFKANLVINKFQDTFNGPNEIFKFTLTDHLKIFNNRIKRSIRSKVSLSNINVTTISNTTIDPISKNRMEIE